MAKQKNSVEADQIRRLVPLNTLSDEQVQELMGEMQVLALERGDTAFRAGDDDQRNVYLVSGRISLMDGAKVVETVASGSLLSRYPIAHQFPRRVSARADASSLCVCVDSHRLNDWLATKRFDSYAVDELEVASGETEDWMSQILGSRVFQMIPAANIQAAMMRMEQVEVQAGDVVFNQGDEGDYYYFINRGRCSLTRAEGPDGETDEIAQLGAGASFGEDALLSGSPRSCTITMLSDGVLLRLSKDDFLDLVKRPLSRVVRYPEAAEAVAQGAVWLDVRGDSDFAASHLPGAQSLPFYSLRDRVSELVTDKHYVAYCEDGSVSNAASFLLVERGFSVSVLRGGLRSLPADEVLEAEISVSQEETEGQPRGEPQVSAVDAGQVLRLQERLKELEATHEQLQRQYQMERRQWSQALAAARNQVELSGRSDPAGNDAAELRRELRQAQARIAKLTQDLEEMEERQLEETQEMHQLWEKRLSRLESEAARQQSLVGTAQKERDEARSALEALRKRCAKAGVAM